MSKFIEIKDFSGGLADSGYRGTAGSFGMGSNGIDIHSTPGLLQSEFKLTKISGTTVTDLITCGFSGSDGSTYFGGNNGKIYKCTSAGVWSLENTLASAILGMAEYNGYFYVAISNLLYRVAKATGMGSLASWQTWTGTEVSTINHQMIHGTNGALLIAAGQYVSMIDASNVWNAEALDLAPGWIVNGLATYADNQLLLAYNTQYDQSACIVWDGYSDSWLYQVPCAENIINAVLSDGQVVILQAGGFGNIYQFNGNAPLTLINQLPGNYTGTATMKVYGEAMQFYYGNILMGVSNSSGNPCDEVVFRLGRHNQNYPRILDKAFIISTGYTSGIDIGSIIQDGTVFYISWKNTTGGTTYGVDKIDYTALANGVYETGILGSNSDLIEGIKYESVTVNFEPLPASCSITLKYRTNGSTSWSTGETINTTNATSYRFESSFPIEAKTIEFQLTLASSGVTTPAINSLLIEYD